MSDNIDDALDRMRATRGGGLLDEAWEPDDSDDEDEPPKTWDGGGMRLMRERCSTCIFWPGNLMRLNDGRLADMTAQCDAADTNVICHQTLGQDVGAVCRGSYDRRPGQMARIAERLGAVVEVDPPAYDRPDLEETER